jgi:hypothetical protein
LGGRKNERPPGSVLGGLSMVTAVTRAAVMVVALAAAVAAPAASGVAAPVR